jgi:hypothetical protein
VKDVRCTAKTCIVKCVAYRPKQSRGGTTYFGRAGHAEHFGKPEGGAGGALLPLLCTDSCSIPPAMSLHRRPHTEVVLHDLERPRNINLSIRCRTHSDPPYLRPQFHEPYRISVLLRPTAQIVYTSFENLYISSPSVCCCHRSLHRDPQ